MLVNLFLICLGYMLFIFVLEYIVHDKIIK